MKRNERKEQAGKRILKKGKTEDAETRSENLPIVRRLGFKLSIFVTAGILVVSVFAVAFMSASMGRVVNSINTERSQQALNNMQSIIEDEEIDSKKAAAGIAKNADVILAVSNKNSSQLKAAVLQAIEESELDVDFVTVTDTQGVVIARTHSDKTGDSIINQKNISLALKGETTTHIDLGTEIKLSMRTGTPIKNAEGQIIGVISTGYSWIDTEFVDKLKEITGNEFTIFIGDERVNTTILNSGERVIGTKIDQDIAQAVLEEGKEYFGEGDILGVPFATAYKPIVDSEGERIGVYFAGVSLEATNRAIRTAIGVSALVVLLLLLLTVFVLVLLVQRMIAHPLSKMAQTAAALARGDLNIELEYHSDDELGILAEALRSTIQVLKSYINDISDKLGRMSAGDMRVQMELEYIGDFYAIRSAIEKIVFDLNQTLRLIHTSAEQVNTGAEQVSAAAQALASGATEQAATIEELNAAVSGVTQQAERNAASVEQAADYVAQAGSRLDEGNTHMEKLNQAMRKISESFDRISSVTKLIEDIAFQTNILALNAAVESARAGAAGKGFAVVADEVRNLAAKSAEAAKQTTELILDTVKSVAEGEKLAQETVLILEEVAVKSERVADATREIESASATQVISVGQINEGLSQVSSVIQTNAASAEESSASSEELAAQAQTLREEIRKFQLKEHKEAGYASAGSREGETELMSSVPASALKY